MTITDRLGAVRPLQSDVLADIAAVAPVGCRVQALQGGIIVSPLPTPEHACTVDLVEDQLRAMDVGRVGANKRFSSDDRDEGARAYVAPCLYVQAREVTDMDIAWARAHAGYFPLSLLRLIVGVASGATRARDLEGTMTTYAAHGVPVYMVVDRPNRGIVVHHDPRRAKREYRKVLAYSYGETVDLPAPFGAFDTTRLL